MRSNNLNLLAFEVELKGEEEKKPKAIIIKIVMFMLVIFD